MGTISGVRRQTGAATAPDWSASVPACPGNASNSSWPAGRLRSSRRSRQVGIAARLQICSFITLLSIAAGVDAGLQPQPAKVTVTIDSSHPVNRFVPSRALGAGVDGHEFGETLRQ